MQDLNNQLIASDAKLARLKSEIAPINAEIAATDWALTSHGQRNGEWAGEALKRREELQQRRALLLPDLQAAERENHELWATHRARQEAQQEAARHAAWAATKRADLTLAITAAERAQEGFNEAVQAARVHLDAQRARVAECKAAELAAVGAQASLTDAKARAYLNPGHETEAVVRQSAAAHSQAVEQAERAVAALPLLKDEIARAEQVLAAAEHDALAASAAVQEAHGALARFDINAAIGQIGQHLDRFATVDPNGAGRLRRALRDGLVTFDHRGALKRPEWLGFSA